MTGAEQVAEYYRRCSQSRGTRAAGTLVRYYLTNAAARLAAKDLTLAAAIKDRIYLKGSEPHGCTKEDLEALAPYLKVRHT